MTQVVSYESDPPCRRFRRRTDEINDVVGACSMTKCPSNMLSLCALEKRR